MFVVSKYNTWSDKDIVFKCHPLTEKTKRLDLAPLPDYYAIADPDMRVNIRAKPDLTQSDITEVWIPNEHSWEALN